MKGIPVLAALLAAALASTAQGATVHLRDGRRLTGTVVSATARDIELFSDGATTRIPAADVLRVDYDDVPAQAAPRPVYEPPPRAPSEPLWREERRQQLGLNLGLSIPLGDVDFTPIGGGSGSNGDVGVGVGGHYLYHPRPRLGWGFAVEYLSRSATDSPGLLASADAATSGGSVVMMAVVKGVLVPSEVVQPFVLAGLGAARTWTVIDAQPRPGFVWNDTGTDETRRLVDGRAWGPAGTVRLGLDFWADAPAMFSLEAGWTAIGGATYAATGEGRALGLSGVSGATHIVTIGGRWGWRF